MDIQKLPSSLEEVAYRDTWGDKPKQYLSTLHERLVLLKELLSPEGSMYLHCDWRMSGFIRLLLDEVFGESKFVNEIVWQGAIGDTSAKNRKFIKSHETIFFYRQGNGEWNDTFQSYSESSQKLYRYSDSKGRYQLGPVDNPGGGGYVYDLGLGEQLPTGGYRMPIETAREWLKSEELVVEPGKVPRRKLYMGEGVRCRDVWSDIRATQGREYLNYPTQKPESLLERIIGASSNGGDLVLDVFAGSGTTCAVAESMGRRWIGADLGRFAIQTIRKRLLTNTDCRPFEVLNLGRYERRYWQGVNAGEAIWEYYRFILDLYSAQQISGFTHLHGQKAGRMVHVGATDAPVTRDELAATLAECAANGITAVDILGWEWEMGLNPAGKNALAREHGVDVHFLNIPREVMDERAVEAGGIHFFELSVADVHAHQNDAGLVLELANFLPAVDEYMQEKVQGKVGKWSDWIDYWSVDFDYDGKTFVNRWQAYRTRREPSLMLRSDPFQYDTPGRKLIVVKVIDIFGNDTTVDLEVDVA